MPDGAARQWIISTGKSLNIQVHDTNLQAHAKALHIADVRDLVTCIDDTTTSTARQVVKLLYSSYELLTKTGKDVPPEQRAAIRGN
jgi:hypothetical protein